jgi:hypothetical protein
LRLLLWLHGYTIPVERVREDLLNYVQIPSAVPTTGPRYKRAQALADGAISGFRKSKGRAPSIIGDRLSDKELEALAPPLADALLGGTPALGDAGDPGLPSLATLLGEKLMGVKDPQSFAGKSHAELADDFIDRKLLDVSAMRRRIENASATELEDAREYLQTLRRLAPLLASGAGTADEAAVFALFDDECLPILSAAFMECLMAGAVGMKRAFAAARASMEQMAERLEAKSQAASEAAEGTL